MPLVTRAANQGIVYRGSDTPSDVEEGSIWIDTTVLTKPVLKIADGTAYLVPKIKIGSTQVSLEAAF